MSDAFLSSCNYLCCDESVVVGFVVPGFVVVESVIPGLVVVPEFVLLLLHADT
jgi:hypothetical protein